jgi:two-component system LytT family response regulator
MVGLEETRRLHERLLTVFQGAAIPPSSPADAPIAKASELLERISVESRGKVKFVPVSEIDFIAASGPYAELVVGTRHHLIRESMHALEERLDPSRFMRVHRSAIVQLDRVDTLLKGAGGDYEVQLKDGTRLRVSRSRREQLEKRLGMG